MRLTIQAAPLRYALAAGLTFILGLGSASAARADGYAGRAFAASVKTGTLGGGTVYFSDTGDLPSGGGWEYAGLAGTAGAALSADVFMASTSGASYADSGSKVSSSASLADVVVLPGSPAKLTASFVRSQTNVTADQLAGSTEVDGLVFGGLAVQVTGDANQTVQIPGVATLVINEQVLTDGPVREVRVNALHLTVATGEEVILSSARSSINSAQ
jgi:hypothetical protein